MVNSGKLTCDQNPESPVSRIIGIHRSFCETYAFTFARDAIFLKNKPEITINYSARLQMYIQPEFDSLSPSKETYHEENTQVYEQNLGKKLDYK